MRKFHPSSHRRSFAPLFIEPLEARIAPAIIVARTGISPNFFATFTDDGLGDSENSLVIRFNAAQVLEFSADGAAFTTNLGGGNTVTFATLAGIQVELGGDADDQLEIGMGNLALGVSTLPAGNGFATQVTLDDSATTEEVIVLASGIGKLRLTSVGGDDTLTISSGQGDSVSRLDNSLSASIDRFVSTDYIPTFEFGSFQSFRYTVTGSGTNRITVAPLNLASLQISIALSTDDILTVEGNGATNDAFAISRPAAGVTRIAGVGATLDMVNLGGGPSLEIFGLGGDDSLSLNVAPELFSNPIVFNGGTGNDSLTVSGTPPVTVDESIYLPGHTPGSATLRYESAANAVLLDLALHDLESVLDSATASKLTVFGTEAVDAITYEASSVVNAARVTIGGVPILDFSNKTTLSLNGLGGNDAIDLFLPSTTPTGLTGISINNVDFMAEDTLVIRGTFSNETISYSPFSATSGNVNVGAFPLISIAAVSDLTLQGGGGSSDVLQIVGTGASEFIFHTPLGVNEGRLQVGTLLAARYTLLRGSITVDGAGGSVDTLVVNGRDNDDSFVVLATSGTVAGGDQLPITPLNLERVQMNGLGGKDSFFVNRPTPYERLTANGGGDGDSFGTNGITGIADTASLAMGNDPGNGLLTLSAVNFDYTGMGSVQFFGNNDAGDAITIQGTFGGDLWRVGQHIAGRDEVAIDGREVVSFNGVTAVTLNSGSGVDTYEVRLSELSSPYTIQASSILDVVKLLGTPGGDSITATATSITMANATLNFSGVSTALVEIEGRGGVDLILVNAFTARPVRIDGGEGNDFILGTAQNDVIFGGPGNDTIIPGPGGDTVSAGSGDDVLVWNVDSSADNFDGGEGIDQLLFNGNAGSDNFFVLTTGAQLQIGHSSASFSSFSVTSSVEQLAIDAGGGLNTIAVSDLTVTDLRLLTLSGTGTDQITIQGRNADDNLTVSASGPNVSVLGLRYDIVLQNAEFASDSLVINGNDGNDRITISPAAAALLPITANLGPGQASQAPLFATGQAFASPANYDLGKGPTALATADLNSDGLPDIVTVNSKSKSLTVLLGTPGGSFEVFTSFPSGGTLPKGIALGDFNGDTMIDIAVTNNGSKNIGIMAGNGDGTFGSPTLINVGPKPGALQAADLDGDNIPDLVTLSGNNLATLKGNGDGTFAAAVLRPTGGLVPVALAIADFNGDAIADIVTANSASANISYFGGTGSGNFAAVARFGSGLKPSSLTVGDFNLDGRPDLAVSHSISRFVSIFQGRGDLAGAQFAPRIRLVTPGVHAPSAITTADLDGDGRLDLALANSASGSVSILLGAGGLSFRTPIITSLDNTPPRKVSAIAIADFNNDGLLDIATTNSATNDLSVLLRVI